MSFFLISSYILEFYLWKCFEIFEIFSSRESYIFIWLKNHFNQNPWPAVLFLITQMMWIQDANSCESHPMAQISFCIDTKNQDRQFFFQPPKEVWVYS